MSLVIQRGFSDFDELSEVARGWSLDFDKLDTTPFLGEIFQLVTEDFILSRGRFNCRLKQRGCPPPGFRTVTVPVDQNLRMQWRGKPVTGNDLLVFPLGGELDAFSNPYFDVFTLSFDENSVIEISRGLGFPEMECFFGSAEVYHCQPRQMERLRRCLNQVSSLSVQGVGDTDQLKNRVLTRFISLAMKSLPGGSPQGRALVTGGLVRRAEQIITRNPGHYLKVKDLSLALGVSIRTLQSGFQAHLGVSPKAFINFTRLNAVHKQLRKARPGSLRVADVANVQGFWHMGQFAADYRKVFGENPSITLERII